MLRTMKVSISTPRATVTPICSSMRSGATAMAAKVPARMTPAEVITEPVRAEAIRMPSCTPTRSLSSRTRLIRKML